MELFPPPSVDANTTRYCLFLPNSLDCAQQCQSFLSFAEQQTKSFLWHKQRFHLQVATCQAGSYLRGSTSVGDAIQDEWVVAKLLFDLTKLFPGVVARVMDSDGEFLLIESAEALPEWVTPESSDRRVFIVDGKLHIAPPAKDERLRSKEGELFDQDALQLVLDESVQTQASAAVQRLIQHKLDQVPTYIKENRHIVRCLLPKRAAKVLELNKELVAPAVEAFYYREPKHAGLVYGKMTTFMPKEDGVAVEKMVTFSRAMFAQLKQQQFFPPKPFIARGDPRFRVLETGTSEENSHPDALAADIGVKLTCGLELLYNGEGEDQMGRRWKNMIEELMQDDAEFKTMPIEPDDDDSWLYMQPDTLESQLQRAAMAGSAASPGGADELQNMAAMFGKFVDGVSGVEGVEGAEPVQFDMSSFMDILNGQIGGSRNAAGLDAPWGEHFMDEDEPSESDSDDETDEKESSVNEEDLALEEAMAEMEAELAETKIAKSFTRFEEVGDDEKVSSPPSHEDNQVGSDTQPLDLDYNLLSNLLESVASQEGHAGPVSTILSEMNFPKASV